MKKIILSVVAVALFAVHTQAQISVGVRGGFNLTNAIMVDWEGERMNYEHFGSNDSARIGFTPGFQVGLVVNIPISESFVIQPGLLFATQGARSQWFEHEREEDVDGWWRERRERTSINLNYIQIPINAQIRLPFGNDGAFLINAGPYLGIAIGGRDTWEGRANGEFRNSDGETTSWRAGEGDFHRIQFGSNTDAEQFFSRFDFGIGAGLGVQFGNFQIGVNYQFGLINIMNQWETDRWNADLGDWEDFTTENSFRNHGLSFTVTYMFGGR